MSPGVLYVLSIFVSSDISGPSCELSRGVLRAFVPLNSKSKLNTDESEIWCSPAPAVDGGACGSSSEIMEGPAVGCNKLAVCTDTGVPDGSIVVGRLGGDTGVPDGSIVADRVGATVGPNDDIEGLGEMSTEGTPLGYTVPTRLATDGAEVGPLTGVSSLAPAVNSSLAVLLWMATSFQGAIVTGILVERTVGAGASSLTVVINVGCDAGGAKEDIVGVLGDMEGDPHKDTPTPTLTIAISGLVEVPKTISHTSMIRRLPLKAAIW